MSLCVLVVCVGSACVGEVVVCVPGSIFFFFNLLPIAPVSFRKTLDCWPASVSSAG